MLGAHSTEVLAKKVKKSNYLPAIEAELTKDASSDGRTVGLVNIIYIEKELLLTGDQN
jgi:hypothetical protein